MAGGQRIRAVLYYISLISFLLGLPFILSFALGYKFNPRTLLFTKTGIIFIKTHPQGAYIYLDRRLLGEMTPATIGELLPGEYKIKLELKGFYPWASEVNVEGGKVSYLDKVLLFPKRPDIKQLNKEAISAFWPDYERASLYYIDYTTKAIYRSDFEGEQFRRIAILPGSISRIKELKVSSGGEKLLCFNQHNIVVVNLEPPEPAFVLEYPDRLILDAFWHSDNYHVILVTSRNIEALEARPDPVKVNLLNLTRKNTSAFYDDTRDILYFLDLQKAGDGKFYDNIYKLELGSKQFPFQELIKPRTNE